MGASRLVQACEIHMQFSDTSLKIFSGRYMRTLNSQEWSDELVMPLRINYKEILKEIIQI